MNLFVIGHGAGARAGAARAVAALEAFVADTRFLAGEPARTWVAPSGRCVVAWIAHGPAAVGEARHVVTSNERVALFAGRPISWEAGAVAGSAPLHAAFYDRPAAAWAAGLDGRCTAARYDDADGVAELYADPLGAYALLRADDGAIRWLGNNATVLAELAGDRGLSPAVLASVLGGGWSLGGDPALTAVRRVAPGSIIRMDDRAERHEALPGADTPVHRRTECDVAESARLLVAVTGALAGWPGRPAVVPTTGGRDSRLVLAAAMPAGVPFTCATGGTPGEPDMVLGARLAELAGVEHDHLPADPWGSRLDDPARAARIAWRLAGGTTTLADAAGFPLGPREGPLPVFVTGQGGEIVRRYYGDVGRLARDPVEALYRRFVARRPGRLELLSAAGADAVRRPLRDWVAAERERGTARADLGDAFYLRQRMGAWAGAGHGCVEPVRDAASPLWSWRLLRELSAAGRADRRAEAVHRRLIVELAPELASLEFQDGSTWADRRSPAARTVRRGRVLGAKARRELARRRGARHGTAAAPPAGAARTAAAPADPLPAIRDAVLSAPAHPAWEVLDRPRVETLLTLRPAATDPMRDYWLWRLATVFLGPNA